MKKPSELSISELTKYKYILKVALIAFGIVAIFAALLLYFLKAKPVLYIPVMVLPVIALPMIVSLKSMSDEIRSRNSESTIKL